MPLNVTITLYSRLSKSKTIELFSIQLGYNVTTCLKGISSLFIIIYDFGELLLYSHPFPVVDQPVDLFSMNRL